MAATQKTREGSSLIVHPVYTQFKETWTICRDLYEGTGGFLDPNRPYLIPHPREWNDHSEKNAEGKWVPKTDPSDPSPKLKMRRKLARYENLAAAVLDPVAGALFLTAPTRTFAQGKENPKISAFWKNCDGKGTSLTTFMRKSWLVSGVFGHTPILMEKPETQAATAADQGLPYLCRYTPLDVLDWLEDDEQRLTSVKLAEIAPRTSFEDRATGRQRMRVRVVDAAEWRLYDASAVQIDKDSHGFSELPFVILYAKDRLLTPFIGKQIIGDPFLHLDVYNLTSEVRELLRNQTFAILNIPIGPEGSVEREQELMGKQSGTSTALFSSQAAAYISPDGANVQAYHEHLDKLARMIYRLANAPWEGDSRDAEAADSLRIKRAEQDQVLKTYAMELQRVEVKLTELAYQALYGDKAQAQMEADGVTIAYSDTFQPVDLTDVTDRITGAIAADLGETAMKELKKRLARFALPDASKATLTKIDEEIEAQQYVSEEDKRQQEIDQAASRFAGGKAA